MAFPVWFASVLLLPNVVFGFDVCGESVCSSGNVAVDCLHTFLEMHRRDCAQPMASRRLTMLPEQIGDALGIIHRDTRGQH